MDAILNNTNLLIGVVMMLAGVLDVAATKFLMEPQMKKANGGVLKKEQETVIRALYICSAMIFALGVYFYGFQPIEDIQQP